MADVHQYVSDVDWLILKWQIVSHVYQNVYVFPISQTNVVDTVVTASVYLIQ